MIRLYRVSKRKRRERRKKRKGCPRPTEERKARRRPPAQHQERRWRSRVSLRAEGLLVFQAFAENKVSTSYFYDGPDADLGNALRMLSKKDVQTCLKALELL